ncbi:MAG: phytanoyl-CoA dioxygenase family protein [Alphaproteobacteria bacterium]
MIDRRQWQFWEDNGYLIVEGVLPPERTAAVRAALDARFDAEGEAAGAEGSDNPGVRRLCNLFSKGEAFERLGTEPIALEMAQRTIGDDIRWQAMNFHDPLPGDERPHQPIHADRSFFPGCLGYVNVIWAIDAMTDANGGTRLVPGSHKRPWPLDLADPRAPVEGEIVVACPAGSAIFVHGDTWHGGRANRSTSRRRAIHMGLACPNTAPQYHIAEAITAATRQRLGPLCRLIPAPLADFERDETTKGRTLYGILAETRTEGRSREANVAPR